MEKAKKISAVLLAALQIPQILIWYTILETLKMDSLVIKATENSYALVFDGSGFTSALFGRHILPILALALILFTSLLLIIKRNSTFLPLLCTLASIFLICVFATDPQKYQLAEYTLFRSYLGLPTTYPLKFILLGAEATLFALYGILEIYKKNR